MLDGRRLNHHVPSWAAIVVPSMRVTVVATPAKSSCTARPSPTPSPTAGANCATTAATAASLSSTCELISPEATYGSYSSASSDSGCSWPPRAASTCMAASMPVSALKKSRK